jgi:lipid-A-disaccharide synthase
MVDCVGLPNIASGEKFLPELIQDDCTPPRIAGALGEILTDPLLRDRLRAKGLSLRERLRGPGPAEAVVSMLGKEAEGAWA